VSTKSIRGRIRFNKTLTGCCGALYPLDVTNWTAGAEIAKCASVKRHWIEAIRLTILRVEPEEQPKLLSLLPYISKSTCVPEHDARTAYTDSPLTSNENIHLSKLSASMTAIPALS
jgi:hypothetical protein